ncbi:MAG: epoxyqueuosine reductase QueH [Lachnospiraceae bacterium]|nr:epoxyqueuosine reductase QueH [Lachnospiraceae bacterium]
MNQSNDQKENFQKKMEKILLDLDSQTLKGADLPRLFLHACCAPCSSAVLERLRAHFRITVFYYNPNISAREEYQKRLKEEIRLIAWFNAQNDGGHEIDYIAGDYEPQRFYEAARGLEREPEGGTRCRECFQLRLGESVTRAETLGYDYVTTTLTISPLKNAALLNEIGSSFCRDTKVKWLPSDFKKEDGYKRSIELSRECGLYRQNYCGCVFSQQERTAAVPENNITGM